MNKFLALTVAVFLAFAPPVFAEKAAETRGDLIRHKFARGWINILASPLEIPMALKYTVKDPGVILGVPVGFVQGTVMTAVRIFTGAYEILSAPFPYPQGYRPVIEPEFSWQIRGPYGTR
ncbi:MAG: exosortase system-associated protein, TIGR04073 family [Candidatus Omnitrophica bacterium]|nr:exosortase system-associated protein, TIGR04073 family [Candidatus Omnitrophota bacterium]